MYADWTEELWQYHTAQLKCRIACWRWLYQKRLKTEFATELLKAEKELAALHRARQKWIDGLQKGK